MSVETATSFNAQTAEFKADSLLVWDMQKYQELYKKNNSWSAVRRAMVNDGLGLVTEKISSEKDNKGEYYFSPRERAMLQLTPAVNVYYEVADPATGGLLMVPEEFLGTINKDIMSCVSPWRRGLDQKVMGAVKDVFLQNPDQKGSIVWTSTKAEAGEGPEICACNGQYGWLYKGDLDRDDAGRRRMTVYNFKYPGSPDVAMEFIYRGAEKIVYAVDQKPASLGDEVMTTVVSMNPEIDMSSEAVWQHMSAIQKEVTGDGKIFGLSVDSIVKLQDPKLHQFLKIAVADRMAAWMVGQMINGIPVDRIQVQVRQRFIDATREALTLYLNNDLYGGRKVKDVATETETEDYSGSSGDSCGGWGSRGGASAEKSGGCKEIECRRCGWKPTPDELMKMAEGKITTCPKLVLGKNGSFEPCGATP